MIDIQKYLYKITKYTQNNDRLFLLFYFSTTSTQHKYIFGIHLVLLSPLLLLKLINYTHIGILSKYEKYHINYIPSFLSHGSTVCFFLLKNVIVRSS